MRVRLANPVVTKVDPEGRLLLAVPATGASFLFAAEETGMWIELWRHGGDVARAADRLAERWDVEPSATLADLRRWAAHLCSVGLAKVD
ncbi:MULTISPECIES: hypothetical protein [Actinosynnema]|uniref:hypothetical protein n=1 Tax=Actinosynnema TaxID=40566 RepID=UPI0020A5C4F5|nr:hypothetical protein [Actinosynnema pretiosum]